MMRGKIAKLLVGGLVALSIILTACDSRSPGAETIDVTEFGRMLGFVPYSYLEEHDIWFGDPRKARQIYGIEDMNSYDALMSLPREELEVVKEALAGVAGVKWSNESAQLARLIGYDAMAVNRTVFVEVPPPWCFSVCEGDFDEDLIKSKLAEQGYEEQEYGSFTYHRIFDDFEQSLESEMGQLVLASMNRVAVLEGTIVTAPATGIMTGILDAMAGDEVAVMDNPACKALAASLGEVLSAVIVTPDRVLNPHPESGEMSPFNFTIPEDWGLLHQYDMLGMGYKNDGEECFWVISLYYKDAEAASADAGELVKRMEDYIFYTQFEGMENTPLTALYEVGEPTVQRYHDGATLAVVCRNLSETGGGTWLGSTMMRDLLFLAPEPSLVKD